MSQKKPKWVERCGASTAAAVANNDKSVSLRIKALEQLLDRLKSEELFQRLDYDSSGFLTLSDLQAFIARSTTVKTLWDRLKKKGGTNNDVQVSLAEWETMWTEQFALGEVSARERFAWFGKVASSAEQNAQATLFDRLDRDNSGSLTQGDLQAFCAGSPHLNEEGAKTLWKELRKKGDTNDDDKVSLAEWEHMWAAERAKDAMEMVNTLRWFEIIAGLNQAAQAPNRTGSAAEETMAFEQEAPATGDNAPSGPEPMPSRAAMGLRP